MRKKVRVTTQKRMSTSAIALLTIKRSIWTGSSAVAGVQELAATDPAGYVYFRKLGTGGAKPAQTVISQ
jgi:hypothetical protein